MTLVDIIPMNDPATDIPHRAIQAHRYHAAVRRVDHWRGTYPSLSRAQREALAAMLLAEDDDPDEGTR